ncbi:MAG: hypothetical protein PHI63_04760 [Patescibacteria group bacterium]|nr:hypothetical protein [Patescibacteria group bacterium]
MKKTIAILLASAAVGAGIGYLSVRFAAPAPPPQNLGYADRGGGYLRTMSFGSSTSNGIVLPFEYATASNEPGAASSTVILNTSGADSLWMEIAIAPDQRHSTGTVKMLLETSTNGTDWFAVFSSPSSTSPAIATASTTFYLASQSIIDLRYTAPASNVTTTASFNTAQLGYNLRGAPYTRVRMSAPLGAMVAAERTEPIRIYGSITAITERSN